MATGFSAVTYALCKKSTSAAINKAVEDIKKLLDDLSGGMRFMGAVDTFDDLPENPATGDLYIIKETGERVVWDGYSTPPQWIVFEENYYTKEEVDSKVDNLATIQALQDEINRAIARENELQSLIPTKTSQLTNDSGFLTEHQDISGKADKSYVDEQLNLKQDKLISGENIKTINGQSVLGSGDLVIEAGEGTVKSVNGISPDDEGNVKIEIPSLDGYATEQWVEDKHYLTENSLDNYYTKDEVYNKQKIDNYLSGKQDVLTAGKNITIELDPITGNTIISAVDTGGGRIGKNFTTDIKVGHLEANTEIHEDDLIADILYSILHKKVSGLLLFKYADSTLPIDIDNTWGSLEVDDSIVNTGIDLNYSTNRKAYLAFAIPQSLGRLIHVYQNHLTQFDLITDLEVINTSYDGDDYFLYRFNERSTAGDDVYTLKWK